MDEKLKYKIILIFLGVLMVLSLITVFAVVMNSVEKINKVIKSPSAISIINNSILITNAKE